MKKLFYLFFVVFSSFANFATAEASICKSPPRRDQESPAAKADFYMSSTGTILIVPTVATTIYCAFFDNAEVTKNMILREATLLKEEGKIFEPSFLGGYADHKGMSLDQAVEDVLTNGVQ